jgi:outer membrane protein
MRDRDITTAARRSSMATLAALAVLLAAGPAWAQARILSLDEALKVARDRQPQLRAVRAQARQAEMRTGQARAAYLPRVDAQAQYQRATPNFQLSPMLLHTPLTKNYQAQNDVGLGDSVNYYTFGVFASQLIYDFGKASSLVAQAEANQRASGADERTLDLTTGLNVRVAYYGVLAAQELLAVGEQAVRNQRKHVEHAARFVAAGQRTRFDLSTVELALANAKLALVRTRDAVALAKIRLNTAIGFDGPVDFTVIEPSDDREVPEGRTARGLVTLAEQQRPELAKADAQLEMQRAGARAARAGYLPALSALGGVSGAKVEGYGAGYDWFVGIGLSWNLFNGFSTSKQVADAKAGGEAAAAQRESVHLTIAAEIEEQRLAISDAMARAELAESTVATATERLQLAEHRYETGAGEVLDLDDAQITLSNAEAQRVQARYDLAISRARLNRALGRD